MQLYFMHGMLCSRVSRRSLCSLNVHLTMHIEIVRCAFDIRRVCLWHCPLCALDAAHCFYALHWHTGDMHELEIVVHASTAIQPACPSK